MTEKVVKVPGPDHPITIEPSRGRVVVSLDGRVIADTERALTLREGTYPPVHYIPNEDVDFSLLERSDLATYCPYKGDCAYYSITLGDGRTENVVWTYEAPYPAVEQIRGHVAFYPNRVNISS